MKMDPRNCRAFTLIELMVVLAILSLFTALFVCAQEDPEIRERRERIGCMSNLKQIGLAFRLWSNEHRDRFPMQYDIAQGGSRDAVDRQEPWLHFQVLSNELVKPRLLICPTDDRQPAANFANLTFTNVSYFVGLDADETIPQMLLAGDRNVTNGVPPRRGILELVDAPPAGWTEALHNEVGNVGLTDGSARHLTRLGLQRQITAANDSNKRGITRLHLPITRTR